MTWRIIQQPNGLYAKFSNFIDDFTHCDMTRDEAFELCCDCVGHDFAKYKMEQADRFQGRFDRAIGTIREVHGVDVAMTRRLELGG